MWNGSHPPGRIIAVRCTRTHVTRVASQGRRKWVSALSWRAVVTVVLVVYPLLVQRPRDDDDADDVADDERWCTRILRTHVT